MANSVPDCTHSWHEYIICFIGPEKEKTHASDTDYLTNDHITKQHSRQLFTKSYTRTRFRGGDCTGYIRVPPFFHNFPSDGSFQVHLESGRISHLRIENIEMPFIFIGLHIRQYTLILFIILRFSIHFKQKHSFIEKNLDLLPSCSRFKFLHIFAVSIHF